VEHEKNEVPAPVTLVRFAAVEGQKGKNTGARWTSWRIRRNFSGLWSGVSRFAA